MASKTRKTRTRKNKNKKHGGGHGASTRGHTRGHVAPVEQPKTVFDNIVPSGVSNKTRRFTRARQQPKKSSFWNINKIFPAAKKGFF